MTSFKCVVVLLVILYPEDGFLYNIYRPATCSYYDNPIFAIELPGSNAKIQNRVGLVGVHNPMDFTDNHLQKERYKYQTYLHQAQKYQPVPKLPKVGYYMTPAHSIEMQNSQEEEPTVNFDSDQFWKVGEVPKGTKAVFKLPDVYVEDDQYYPQQPEDAPPISDIMSIEKSELTVETHDLEDVEIEEKGLKDPTLQPEEVIVETIQNRDDLSANLKVKTKTKPTEEKIEKKEAIKESPIMKIKPKDTINHNNSNTNITTAAETNAEKTEEKLDKDAKKKDAA